MPKYRVRELFPALLVAALLALLLLGQTTVNYLVFGALGVVLLFASPSLTENTLPKNSWLFWLPVAFLGVLAGSLLLSIHLPFSLQSFTFFSLSVLVFWFVLTLKRDVVSTPTMLQSLVVTGFFMAFLSSLLAFFPSAKQLLDGMNLLHAFYGHNHLAALMIMVLPLAWWWLFTVAGKKLSAKIFLHRQTAFVGLAVLFLSASLLTSFGRTATFIGIVQLAVIGYFMIKNKTHQLAPAVITVVLALFFVVAGLQLLFSLPNEYVTCPTEGLQTQLCKPFTRETRPLYWEQATQLLKNSPLLGFGPGTFSLTAKEYQQTPFFSSAYAHNAFLQMFAETGLVGGSIFLLLMAFLLWQAWLTAKPDFKNQSLSWKKAALIAVISSYANALLDFDWSFIGIFVITLILLAVLIGERLSQRKSTADEIFPFARIVINGAVVFLGFMYAVTAMLLSAEKANAAARVFPYFHWHRQAFITSTLDDNASQKIASIYRHDPDFYVLRAQQAENEDQKMAYRQRVTDLDVWKSTQYDLLSYYLKQEDWQSAERELNTIADLVAQGRPYGFSLSYEKRQVLALNSIALADQLYRDGSFTKAGEYYSLAQSFDEWVLAKNEPVFLTHSTVTPSQTLDFFVALYAIGPEYFGNYRDQYAEYYFQALLANITAGDIEQTAESVRGILNLNDWLRWLAGDQVVAPMLVESDRLLQAGDTTKAQRYLDELFAVWSLYQWRGFEMNFVYEKHLAENFIRLAETGDKQSAENYQRAEEIIPWILTEEK